MCSNFQVSARGGYRKLAVIQLPSVTCVPERIGANQGRTLIFCDEDRFIGLFHVEANKRPCQVAVVCERRNAVTMYESVGGLSDARQTYTLIQLRIFTESNQQIRVHMSHIGPRQLGTR